MASASEKADSKKLLRERSSMLLAPGAAVLGAAAGLPGVLAGFAAHLRLGLRPGQRGEALGNAGGFDKVVRHVDEELEGQAEAVFDQARGDEDGLGGAEGGVAMADGAVAELDGVDGGDHGFAGVGNGQRNKVVGAAGEARERARRARRPTSRSRSESVMRVSPHAA